MPQRANSNDKDIINDLLARQDDVIGELDKLEADILEAIGSHSTARLEEQTGDASSAFSEEAETIKIPQSGQATDEGNHRPSRAA